MQEIRRTKLSDVQEPKLAEYFFASMSSSWIWLVLRLWLGIAWFQSGWGKLNNPAWMESGEALKNFWLRAVAMPDSPARPVITYDWYRGFLQFLLDTNSHTWFAKLVPLGETLIGAALILGAFVGIAAFFGAFMNMNFMLAGTASTNPVLLLVAMLLILAWKVAGYYGLDRWILPALGTPWYAGWLMRLPRKIPPIVPRGSTSS